MVRTLKLDPAKVNPTGGASLGTPTNATLRIVDNDRLGSQDSKFFTALGTDADVTAVAVYTNAASTNFGKALIAGDFHTINGVTMTRVARLNSDGTVDASFNAGAGPKYA